MEQELVDANDPAIQTVQNVVTEIEGAPVMKAYRVLGGNLMTSSLMKMEDADMNVKLEEEVDSITALAGHVLNLSKTELAAYGEREAEIPVPSVIPSTIPS